ncbi:unnamed protein product [Cercopithifilaria johnstoni]|uniref:AD domain-containing protein n=1 Tax=Cercopithifilaria johnstoni TaxID=2874296 RepID=A0A8J2M9M5_9BILA|nr:unnamed protein product [Cercopithifilaria johnstoni]
MEETCTSSVFNLSVSSMYDLCGQPVAVDLVNNKTVCGNIFTFDPISYSVVIIVFSCNLEPKTVRVIPGISIKHLRNLDDQLPDGCIKKTPELECWLGKLLRVAPQSSKQQVSERRKRLVEWLEQNQIRVKNNNDGSVTVFDTVRIVAPFTAEDCFCDNAVMNRTYGGESKNLLGIDCTYRIYFSWNACLYAFMGSA